MRDDGANIPRTGLPWPGVVWHHPEPMATLTRALLIPVVT